MKKLITLALLAAIMAVGNLATVAGQSYYKKYFINQNFDEIETWPTGWSVLTGTASGNYANLGRNGGIAISGQKVAFSGSGSGTRGAELSFPSTSEATFGYPADSIWNIEFDWTIVTTAASLSMRNAYGIVFSGSNGLATNAAETWYLPAVFGLYVYKNGGYIHYMNLDRDGLPKRSDDGSIIPGETNGQVFLGGNWQSFTRASTDQTVADSLNAPSATTVTCALGATYHITAQIDFKVASQKVLSLTITDVDNPENTATIGEQAFLAPTCAGTSAATAKEDRIVTDLKLMSMLNTRATGGSPKTNGADPGNGNSANLAGGGIDNLEIYILKPSLGHASATVNYKDRDGVQAKASRVVDELEIGEMFTLVSADKARFNEGGNYYAYDEDATHAANAGKGTDGETVEVAAGGVSLDVIFKKTAATTGTYVWTGAEGPSWDELQSNFSVNNGAAIAYQAGNEVAFSKADAANKEVSVDGIMDIGDKNVSVSADGYSFTGAGRITGTGIMNVDVATSLGFESRLDGGVAINTTAPVSVKHKAAAKSYNTTVDNATIKIETVSDRDNPTPLPVNGQGGTINLSLDSITPVTYTVTNASTVNLALHNAGSQSSTRWTTSMFSGTSFPKFSQVNVTTDVAGAPLPTGLGVPNATFDSIKVHIGNNIRMVRDYNEASATASGTVVKIGELTGDAGSFVEGGWVDGRAMTYQVGSLGTDAEFNGTFRAHQKYTAATETDPEAYTASTSAIYIEKVGTGAWTVNGSILIPTSTVASSIIATEGKLVLAGPVNLTESTDVAHTINVKKDAILELKNNIEAPSFNAAVLTIDSAGTFINHGGKLGAYTVDIYGIYRGTGIATANVSAYENAIFGFDVKSFADGDYEYLEIPGDINVSGSSMYLTVWKAEKNQKIQILKYSGNPDIQFSHIYVNDEEITDNTASTAGAKFWFNQEMGELNALDDFTSIPTVGVERPVKAVRYYNVLGTPVLKNATGIVIRETIYDDNSKKVEKLLIPANK
ncbi:MAG: hypothetical protein LBR64_07550 [Dysgonamonadaceae bacterium]|jgi:hypothetical protein|nr:hypothetical protein [Dysgonamonadaceae bacterium]